MSVDAPAPGGRSALAREPSLQVRCLARPAADRLLDAGEHGQALATRQGAYLNTEILVLFERMPVLEVDIGAPSIPERQHEARRARMHVTERPVALDLGDVGAREAVAVGIERVEHVSQLVDPVDARLLLSSVHSRTVAVIPSPAKDLKPMGATTFFAQSIRGGGLAGAAGLEVTGRLVLPA